MSSEASSRIHCLRPLPDDRSDDPQGTTPQGTTRSAITVAIVRLLRARTGRGPTVAKTEMSSDLALVSIADCLTATDRTLLSEGHDELASQVRAAVYDGMRDEAIAAVEAITGRRVTAYLTAHRHDPALALIAFHFSPIPALRAHS